MCSRQCQLYSLGPIEQRGRLRMHLKPEPEKESQASVEQPTAEFTIASKNIAELDHMGRTPGSCFRSDGLPIASVNFTTRVNNLDEPLFLQ